MNIEDRIWNSYDELGSTALARGLLSLAERMHYAAVQEAERANSKGRFARSCSALARVYSLQSNAKLAKHFYHKALSIYERDLDQFGCQLALTCDKLAALYLKEGSLSRARTLLRRAIAMYELLLGPDNPALAPCLLRLAYIYAQWKRFDKAPQLLPTFANIARTCCFSPVSGVRQATD